MKICVIRFQQHKRLANPAGRDVCDRIRVRTIVEVDVVRSSRVFTAKPFIEHSRFTQLYIKNSRRHVFCTPT